MTEQELISKLQGLKQIKPDAQWVSLSKANIFAAKPALLKPASRFSLSNILGLFAQKRLAFAFATLLFVFAGTAGLINYQINSGFKVASLNSGADIAAVNTLKEEFKAKSQILANVVKDKSQNPEVAIKEVKAVASKLTTELQKNPALVKVVALDVNNNKTLLDVDGGNNTEEANDLYKTLDESLIKALKDATLTPEQEIERGRIVGKFEKGDDYPGVLTAILLLNISRDSKTGEANK